MIQCKYVKLNNILIILYFYSAGFSNEANDAANRAENARQKAENASSHIENIISKLPKDRTTVIELETVIRSTNIDVNTALNQGIKRNSYFLVNY
jgi:enamine deaminase RidA (YjgF/YER057c/UK114 family)